jgi:hypothetical protein
MEILETINNNHLVLGVPIYKTYPGAYDYNIVFPDKNDLGISLIWSYVYETLYFYDAKTGKRYNINITEVP